MDDIKLRLPVGEGVATVWAAHTTAAVTAMDLDPGTDRDFLDFLMRIVPDKARWRPYDPLLGLVNVSTRFISPRASVPFAQGRLSLGCWWRVVVP